MTNGFVWATECLNTVHKVSPETELSMLCGPCQTLTDNALISSWESLPSRAAIGVESRTAHVGPAGDKHGDTHIRIGAVTQKKLFLSKTLASRYQDNEQIKVPFQILGAWEADVEVKGLEFGMGEGPEPLTIPSQLPSLAWLFKPGKETRNT